MNKPKFSLLIVDDSEIDQKIYARILEPYDYFEITCAFSGEQCLAYVQEESYDCLITDYNLPDIDGIELMSLIKENCIEQEMPAMIIITGEGNENIAVQALKSGAYDYAVKDTVTGLSLSHSILQAIDKKHLEIKLLNKQEELTMFASRATHDLRAPLRQIKGFSQLLTRSLDLDKENQELFDFILQNVSYMDKLLIGLQEYTKAGRHDVAFSSIDLCLVIEEIKAILFDHLQEAGVILMSTNLPKVWGDMMSLTQLFQNLVANSLKYCSDDPLKIEITAVPQNNQWLISVKDNGIGIDTAYHEEIFLPFRRLHSLKKDKWSSGLGLSTCKRIIEQHKGQIWVESELGKGTTIFFTLPCVPTQESSSTPAHSQTTPTYF